MFQRFGLIKSSSGTNRRRGQPDKEITRQRSSRKWTASIFLNYKNKNLHQTSKEDASPPPRLGNVDRDEITAAYLSQLSSPTYFMCLCTRIKMSPDKCSILRPARKFAAPNPEAANCWIYSGSDGASGGGFGGLFVCCLPQDSFFFVSK